MLGEQCRGGGGGGHCAVTTLIAAVRKASQLDHGYKSQAEIVGIFLVIVKYIYV